jgi:hypothetical protein
VSVMGKQASVSFADRPIAASRACLPVFYIAAIRASANLNPMTVDLDLSGYVKAICSHLP